MILQRVPLLDKPAVALTIRPFILMRFQDVYHGPWWSTGCAWRSLGSNIAAQRSWKGRGGKNGWRGDGGRGSL